jgi:hypothetical protein
MSLFPLRIEASWVTEASTGCIEEVAAPPSQSHQASARCPWWTDPQNPPTLQPQRRRWLPQRECQTGGPDLVVVQRAEAVEIEVADGGTTAQQAPSALTRTDEDLLGTA